MLILSTVIPIPKVIATRQSKLHRPINMLPNAQKVLEAIVNTQLTKYLDLNKVINSRQSGFRGHHSCESALNLVISEWKSSLIEGKFIVAVFLDFQRAFETLDRQRLLEKLKKYGIIDKELKWFTSYLNNRSQKTRFNSVEFGYIKYAWSASGNKFWGLDSLICI